METTQKSQNVRTKSSPPDGGVPAGRGGNLYTKPLFPFWLLPKNPKLKMYAKSLRKAGNLAEVIFWQACKNKQEIGYDVDRQIIIGNYIVDFFFRRLGLVFEIDGATHEEKWEYDKRRDVYLLKLWLEVVHVLDAEVKNNLDRVYEYVCEKIREREIFLREHPALWTLL